MRFVLVVVLIILSISCGKNGESSGSRTSEAEGEFCNLNGQSVKCSSVRGSDGLGIDLLDLMIEAPVRIQGSLITFLADKTSASSGRRISCNINVKNGEVYRFAFQGDQLLMTTNQGQYEMTRLSDGEGINGAWMWKGYVDDGTHVIRTMTFIENTKAILRTSCEL